MKKIGFFLLLLILCTSVGAQEITVTLGKVENVVSQGSYTPSFERDGEDKAPLNIILMIGDGMGAAHIASTMFANGGELTMTNLKTCGWVKTSSATHFTTDSAASGTAYATGHKTHNSALGVDADNERIANLPEKLWPAKIVSGIVTTDNLDGATPSAFFAHRPKRDMSAEIWGDMPASNLLFFAAGNYKEFTKQSEQTRKAIEDKFEIVKNLPQTTKASRIGYLPEKSEMFSEEEGFGDWLPETTRYALEFLSSRTNKGKGFFLMVEGAHIDKYSHGNNFEAMIRETMAFDRAVAEAVKFAEQDGNTLVIISADHETGALTLGDGNPAKGKMKGKFLSHHHTAIPVPLFAYGPSSREFAGFQENSDVSQKIARLLLGE